MTLKQFSTKSDGKLVFFEMLKGKTKTHQNQSPAISILLISFQSKHGNLQSTVSHDYDFLSLAMQAAKKKHFNKSAAQPRGKNTKQTLIQVGSTPRSNPYPFIYNF